MITVKNKNVTYDIENVIGDYKLVGTYNFNSNRIMNFEGHFENTDGSEIGSFYYNELDNGKINKNFNDMNIEIHETLCGILKQTVDEIHNGAVD